MKAKRIAELKTLIHHYTITLMFHPYTTFKSFGLSEKDAYKRMIRKPYYRDYPKNIRNWKIFKEVPKFRIKNLDSGKSSQWY